ncbi:MAG: PilZ domain-containing protein [Hyphomicrobiaceae bacterium]
MRVGRSIQERRRATRHPVDFGATLLLDGGTVVRCQVRDFSSTGAQLVVPSVLGMPEEFMLQAPTGQARRVRVHRRGIARLGVAFV